MRGETANSWREKKNPEKKNEATTLRNGGRGGAGGMQQRIFY